MPLRAVASLRGGRSPGKRLSWDINQEAKDQGESAGSGSSSEPPCPCSGAYQGMLWGLKEPCREVGEVNSLKDLPPVSDAEMAALSFELGGGGGGVLQSTPSLVASRGAKSPSQLENAGRWFFEKLWAHIGVHGRVHPPPPTVLWLPSSATAGSLNRKQSRGD